MKSFFFIFFIGYTNAFIFLFPRVSLLNDRNLIKKVKDTGEVEKVLSFEEESDEIKYCKVGISRGGSCKVKIGIIADDDDDEYCMIGDDEDEDGQPCSQRK